MLGPVITVSPLFLGEVYCYSLATDTLKELMLVSSLSDFCGTGSGTVSS